VRWVVRAAIGAVVADAYGPSNDQHPQVPSTFNHASYKSAPELCPPRFDELKSIGLKAFIEKHDPYPDIPLNENLSQAVIELVGLDQIGGDDCFKLDEGRGRPERKGRSRKHSDQLV